MNEPPPLPGQEIDDGKGRIFPCSECGADLTFHIGEQKLSCGFCGATQDIELSANVKIQEQDFQTMLMTLQERQAERSQEVEHEQVRCDSCGADVLFSGTLTSTECPYCGSPLQREKVHRGGQRVAVDAVLPFQIDLRKAQTEVGNWVKSRWFAPNEFKKRGAQGKINGVYLPFWTFDTLTFNVYEGERGEDYTETVGTGDKKRTVTKTRWYFASGRFQRFFDDVLINGTREHSGTQIDEVGPWPLDRCLPFAAEFLAGHFARTYDIDLQDAFPLAKQQIDREIHSDCERRIGGDRQRLHWVKSRYDAITFKQVLLPIYLMAYRYRDRTYRVFINAATGTVAGERPYSWIKIGATILGVGAVVLGVIVIANS